MYQKPYVTIFGGTGFVGRYLVDQLAKTGVNICVATRRSGAAEYLKTAGTPGQVVPVFCDIADDTSIAAAIGNSQWVVNLIGTLTEKSKRQRFDLVHADFPARLARLAKQKQVERFVHISAIGADANSKSHYACSKAKGEANVWAEFAQATILRPSIIFGPEDQFFNRFARMAMIMPFLPLVGAKTYFQPVYVGDVSDAILRALTSSSEAVQGKVFELGGPDQLQFRHCMEIMMTYTGQERRLVSLPFGLAKLQGAVLQYLPGQLLTVDQVRSLQHDNVVREGALDLYDLGITPKGLEMILPTYLSRYQQGGRFSLRHRAGQPL